MPAVLAIWADCKPGHEALFEQWYQHEHLPERLAVPGFKRGRRYQAIGDSAHFMTCYDADEAAVFSSPAYLARLNDPTALTQQIMSQAVTNLSRTICDCHAAGGFFTGAYALTIPLDSNAGQASNAVAAKAYLDKLLASRHGLARYEIWLANPESAPDPAAPLTAEQALRGRDKRISGCLMIETLREVDAHQLKVSLCEKLQRPSADSIIYQLLCETRFHL